MSYFEECGLQTKTRGPSGPPTERGLEMEREIQDEHHQDQESMEPTTFNSTYTLAAAGDAGQVCTYCGERVPDYSAVVVEEGGYTHPICALRRDAEEGVAKCAGCDSEYDLTSAHEEHGSGGVTHDCPCGYSLITGLLGRYYGMAQGCEECYPK